MTVDPAAAAPAPPPTAGAPVAAAQEDAPEQSTAAQPSHRHDGGYRETVESILIAFILAFIFRAFVVEAFVIPTGSMAPTLLGAHARFTCDDCGYAFTANFSAPGGDQNIPSAVGHSEFPTRDANKPKSPRPIDCPNCGHTVHDPDDPGRPGGSVPIHYGDRILVLKYAYLLREPERWDVVVFKSPDDPDTGPGDYDRDPGPPNAYGKSWYTTNFIKRLVGRPGESLMILDGDVYVRGRDAAPDDFKIQPKPRHAQDALWRIVCDADFLPRSPAGQARWQPWQVESGAGWDVGTPVQPKRVYTFDGARGAGTILFDNDFVREKQTGDGRPFSDELAYAQSDSGRHQVSDAKLSVLYHRTGGDGPLRLSLSKRDDTFTAELTRGGAKLYRKRGQPAGPDDLGEEVASAEGVSSLGSSPVQVDFMNVDHHVTLRVGGTDLLQTSYPADVAALKQAVAGETKQPRPEIRITASDQACSLAHVSLWRDVYYLSDRSQWASADEPIELGDDEYFVLGDNTVISKDSRYWTDPVSLPDEDLEVAAGRVPGRFLLGKAFFVYWPAGYRTALTLGRFSAVPNFGEMRFIH